MLDPFHSVELSSLALYPITRPEVVQSLSTSCFNRADPHFRLNPYLHYAAFRKEHGPIAWCDFDGHEPKPAARWVVTGYKESARILLDQKTFGYETKDQQKAKTSKGQESGVLKSYSNFAKHALEYNDGCPHDKMRAPLNRFFSRGSSDDSYDFIYAAAQRLYENCLSQKHFDLVDAYSRKLPFYLISSLLGIPEKDFSLIQKYSEEIMAANGLTFFPEVLGTASEGVRNLSAYLDTFTKESPPTTMVELLMGKEDISRKELVANMIFLLIAGYETTMNTISNAVYFLLTRPAEREKVLNDPMGTIEGLIQETLRCEPSVHNVYRRVKADTIVLDTELKKGDVVGIILGATGYDETVFKNPWTFDIARKPGSNLSFGRGAHVCLGKYIAELEAQIAILTLLPIIERLAFVDDDPPARVFDGTLRGFHRMPLMIQ